MYFILKTHSALIQVSTLYYYSNNNKYLYSALSCVAQSALTQNKQYNVNERKEMLEFKVKTNTQCVKNNHLKKDTKQYAMLKYNEDQEYLSTEIKIFFYVFNPFLKSSICSEFFNSSLEIAFHNVATACEKKRLAPYFFVLIF